MGPRVMRRLPKFVHGFIDRHGKPRFYFRRAGHKKLPLPGLPWSPEFMAAYQEAIEGAPRIQIGANRSKTGTVAAAVAERKPGGKPSSTNLVRRLWSVDSTIP